MVSTNHLKKVIAYEAHVDDNDGSCSGSVRFWLGFQLLGYSPFLSLEVPPVIE